MAFERSREGLGLSWEREEREEGLLRGSSEDFEVCSRTIWIDGRILIKSLIQSVLLTGISNFPSDAMYHPDDTLLIAIY